jgi:Tfp pilus assembly protein PilW
MSDRVLADQRGLGLPELLIGILMGTLVIFAALTLFQVVNRDSARTAARVEANQKARIAMSRIMNELRSACLSRASVPILSGANGNVSSPTQLTFQYRTGSDVVPIPEKRVITWTASANDPNLGTLTENRYRATTTTPNSQGVYSFVTTPEGYRPAAVTGVQRQATVGSQTVPIFRYYTYVNGALTELNATPQLSSTDAARTVQVVVTLGVGSNQNPAADDNNATSISDTALLRFAPPSETTTLVNQPCT